MTCRCFLRNCHAVQGHRPVLSDPEIPAVFYLIKTKGEIVYVQIIRFFHANVH